MSQNNWDVRYLQLAAHIATWSKDPKKKVGAVLVRDNRIISTGYNGLPERVGDTFERLSRKATKLSMVVHAEENALLSAGERARGATLYVHGLPVCARCASSIIQARVLRVVAEMPICESLTSAAMEKALSQAPEHTNWNALGELAMKMFHESNVSFVGMELHQEQRKFTSAIKSHIRRSGVERRRNPPKERIKTPSRKTVDRNGAYFG
ncbi:MAG: cytidine/deoxycytidylate deaminase family protein [Parvularculaceae bacterium]